MSWDWDIAERMINVLAPLIIGPLLMEYGLSRWQRRKFQWRNLISIFAIVWGFSMFFKLR